MKKVLLASAAAAVTTSPGMAAPTATTTTYWPSLATSAPIVTPDMALKSRAPDVQAFLDRQLSSVAIADEGYDPLWSCGIGSGWVFCFKNSGTPADDTASALNDALTNPELQARLSAGTATSRDLLSALRKVGSTRQVSISLLENGAARVGLSA